MASKIVKFLPMLVLLCSAVLAAAIIPTVFAKSLGWKVLDVHAPTADYASPMMGDPVPGGGTPMVLGGLG
ncbi:MAG: hypothetical protein WCD81_10080 [Candidatus Bathyarchaeia archaeon]